MIIMDYACVLCLDHRRYAFYNVERWNYQSTGVRVFIFIRSGYKLFYMNIHEYIVFFQALYSMHIDIPI